MFSNFILNIFQRLVFIINYLFSTEINERKLYQNYLVNDEIIVFDIGSNLGNFSKYISKNFGNKNLKIYSYEPQKKLLDKQKVKNGNLFKFNFVISNKSGNVEFYEHEISSQSSLMFNDKMGNQNIKKVTKQSITLEEAIGMANIKKIDILKLDTEGNEYEILDSSQSLLKNGYFKIIKVEISFLKNNQYSDQNFNQINNLMNETEYSFFGFSNAHYQDNKILFFDAFYINNNLLS